MITGTIHNAKACTIDGRDHWVAALKEDHRILDVGAFDAYGDALAWLDAEGKRRGLAVVLTEGRDINRTLGLL